MKVPRRIGGTKYSIVYDIKCNTCGAFIGTDTEHDGHYDTAYRHEYAVDLDKHECTDCKCGRRRTYDHYVDPLGAYH